MLFLFPTASLFEFLELLEHARYMHLFVFVRMHITVQTVFHITQATTVLESIVRYLWLCVRLDDGRGDQIGR